jgi:selenium-binding protein 1
MVEVSRDGRRVYFSNSLYSNWDEQFYPDGIRGWVARADVNVEDGGSEAGFALDPDFFVDFGEERPHQIRLSGGDSSSDSFCYPS